MHLWGRGEPCRGFNLRREVLVFAFVKIRMGRIEGTGDPGSGPRMTETPNGHLVKPVESGFFHATLKNSCLLNICSPPRHDSSSGRHQRDPCQGENNRLHINSPVKPSVDFPLGQFCLLLYLPDVPSCHLEFQGAL